MEDPWAAPPQGVWSLTRPTRDRARDLEIGVRGRACPSPSTARRSACVELIAELNDVVGSYGWGRIDMVENRRVGIKSRETYECPAALR